MSKVFASAFAFAGDVRPIVRGGLLFLCLAPWLPAVAAEDIPTGSCIHLAALESPHIQERIVLAAQSGGARQIRDRTNLRAMTEEEMRQTLVAFEPVRVPKGDTWTIRAMADRQPVNLERMGVVLRDSITLLAISQSRDVLGRLKGSKGVRPADVAWLDRAYQSMRNCAQIRYKDYGGDPAFKESLRIVDQVRPQLESLITKGLEAGTLLPSGRRP